jgi:SAM-dependent methyltransferase
MSEKDTLKKLNIGCGKRPIPGFVNLDITAGEGVDVVFDLETCGQARNSMVEHVGAGGPIVVGTNWVKMPFPDDTFDRMICSHTAEHITNFLPMMEELWRVAKPGCSAVFITPYGGHDTAFEDPTHVRQFFAKSWLYASQYSYGGADYGYRGDWDCKQLVFAVLKDEVPEGAGGAQVMDAIQKVRNICIELTAELIAIKPARIAGTGGWEPEIKVKLV